MKILIVRKDYNNYCTFDSGGTDNFESFGEFLNQLPTLGIELTIEWLRENKDDELRDYLLFIEKENGFVTIYYPGKEEKEIDSFYEKADKVAQVAFDFYQLLRKEKPLALVILYHHQEYYLKSFFTEVVGFKKLIKKEFKRAVGDYVVYGFIRGDSLAALGLLLENNLLLNQVIEVLNTTDFIIPYEDGQVEKKGEDITIKYEKPLYNIFFTTIISEKLFKKIITYYQNFVDQGLESFLLIKTPEGYSFMINPHEEIKVEVES
jgi:hypothetical protein